MKDNYSKELVHLSLEFRRFFSFIIMFVDYIKEIEVEFIMSIKS